MALSSFRLSKLRNGLQTQAMLGCWPTGTESRFATMKETPHGPPVSIGSKIRFGFLSILVAAHLSFAQTNSPLADAWQHATRAASFINKLNADSARRELKEAEKLDPKTNFDLEAQIFFDHCNLHDIADAAYFGRRCLALGRESGTSSNLTDQIMHACRDFEARQVPAFIDATPPRQYTPQQLKMALDAELTPDELPLAVDPLAHNNDMVKWACELTMGATNEMQKARMLFETLSHRLDGGELGFLTARGAFEHWNDTNVSLHCQEYAFLYTSLGRAVGLKAFPVVVDETCYSERTAHACAAVFLGEKAVLIDPSYDWFGVPHKRYRILNDLEAMGLFLSHDTVHMDVATVAYRLAPDLRPVHAAFLLTLIHHGKWAQARLQASQFSKSDPDEWWLYDAEAVLAVHDKDLKKATQLLKRSIQINPLDGAGYINLGSVLYQLGDLSEARNAYLSALNCALPKEATDVARASVDFIGKQDAARQKRSNGK